MPQHFRQQKAALRAGADVLVHSVEDVAVDAEFLSMVLERNVFYCPTLMVFWGYLQLYSCKLGEKIISQLEADTKKKDRGCTVCNHVRRLVSQTESQQSPLGEANIKAFETRVKLQAVVMAKNLMTVMNKGGSIIMGTDAGNPLTLHGPSVFVELEMMQESGMPPAEVLRSATVTAGKLFGKVGEIKTGYSADMLILTQYPSKNISALRSLEAVVNRGNFHSVASLEKLLSSEN
eukprot:TRINITY_DN3037_c0_g2_i1.p1 TRINITY_DN3037_c0_g2~~TRINITY_DN3037_c0_g2_i1.p1  ORF type:complete len:234 (+),score=30.99 TRINITY_DN3037_c0_g2_i1:141-842(+)